MDRTNGITLFFLAASFLFVGCPSPSAPWAAARLELSLREKPRDPWLIGEAEHSLQEDAGSQVIAVIGRIEAGDADPFEKNRSAFLLTDVFEDTHGADSNHDPSTCPFCKRRAENASKAYVTMVDSQQQPYPVSAAELLALRKGDRVVVEGQATWDEELEMIRINGTKIYIER